VALISVYTLYLLVIFIYGLFIWTDPLQRAGALLVGLGALAVTVQLFRSHVFRSRVLVELSQEAGADDFDLAVSVAANPVAATVEVERRDGTTETPAVPARLAKPGAIRRMTVTVPFAGASQLEVWAHRLTPTAESESLQAIAEVDGQE